jgi:hypothetical protein
METAMVMGTAMVTGTWSVWAMVTGTGTGTAMAMASSREWWGV